MKKQTVVSGRLPVYSELLYLLGLIVVCLGSALMVRADLGVETVVAPAYLLYLYLSEGMPFLTFGMVSFVYGCCLVLIVMLVTGQFGGGSLFSLVAALASSCIFDLWSAFFSQFAWDGPVIRILILILGILCCAVGIALCFYGYFTPAPYEFFVKKLSQQFDWKVSRVKTGFDIASCVLGIILSFLFFGFGVCRGVSLGTALCALVTGTVVGWVRNYVDKRFVLRDAFPLRVYFEG